MDILAIEGMRFYAKHGYYAHEKQIGGQYVVDVYLSLNLQKAGKSDLLEDTLNYENVYEIADLVMRESKNLIEHIAYEIIERIAKEFTTIHSVEVKITKLQPPLKGNVDSTSVSLKRIIGEEPEGEAGYWERIAKY